VEICELANLLRASLKNILARFFGAFLVIFCFKMRIILTYLTNFKAKKRKNKRKNEPQIYFKWFLEMPLKANAFLFVSPPFFFLINLKEKRRRDGGRGLRPCDPFELLRS